MSEPLVSCIVPVRNCERYLGAAIDSILAQTYRPLELIVVEGSSTDGSAEVAAGYGERLRLLVTPKEEGPAGRRMIGLRAARGEFVAFLDADDLWHPEKLARQMARFRERPDLEVSVSHIENFVDDDDAPELLLAGYPRGPVPGYVLQATLARRSVFESRGPMASSRRRADSVEWFMRAREAEVVIELLPDVLTFRRLHAANLSRRPGFMDELLDVLKDALDRRRNRPGPSTPREAAP